MGGFSTRFLGLSDAKDRASCRPDQGNEYSGGKEDLVRKRGVLGLVEALLYVLYDCCVICLRSIYGGIWASFMGAWELSFAPLPVMAEVWWFCHPFVGRNDGCRLPEGRFGQKGQGQNVEIFYFETVRSGGAPFLRPTDSQHLVTVPEDEGGETAPGSPGFGHGVQLLA